MEKVVFLLCIPEEENESDAGKIKKDGTGNVTSEENGGDGETTFALQTEREAHEGHRSSLPEPECRLTKEQTVQQASETVGPQQDGKAVSQNGTDNSSTTLGREASPQDRELDTASAAENTLTSTIGTQAAASDKSVSESTQEAQGCVPDQDSCNSDQSNNFNQTVTDTHSESNLGPAVECQDKNIKESVSETSLSAATEEKVPIADGEDSSKGSPLLKKKMMGQELYDDFWDFGPPTPEVAELNTQASSKVTADSSIPQAEQELSEQVNPPHKGEEKSTQLTEEQTHDREHLLPKPKNTDDLQTDAPAEKENQTAVDTIDRTEKQPEREETPEDFITCPSSPESSKKDAADVLEEGEIATAVAEKFTTIPVPEHSILTTTGPDGDNTIQNSQGSSTTTVKPANIARSGLQAPVAVSADKGGSGSLSPPTGSADKAGSGSLSPPTGSADKAGTGSLAPPLVQSASSQQSSAVADSITSEDADTELIDFLPKVPLREQVNDCLTQLNVKNVAWQKCLGDKVWQVTFVDAAGVRCEDILLKLAAIGVGRIKKSSISVLPVTIHAETEGATEEQEAKSAAAAADGHEAKAQQLENEASEFQKSIKSRLVVRQVEKSVQGNAEFTFDYVMLIILASVIAVMGLVENSSVVLVASMLISPLMGPILAGTLGTVTKNTPLRNLGIRSEIIGLTLCLLCGFVCGLIPAGLEAGSVRWRNADEWPTLEMTSRGMFRGLLVGMLIALPSGAGVALSVLGGNIGSLVGVAISASLLPPAVNAGMLWSSALVTVLSPPPLVMQTALRNVSEMVNGTVVMRPAVSLIPVLRGDSEGLLCPQVVDNDYVHTYFCNPAADFAVLGAISLLLTILNILCIFLMGVVVLKVKEVAPRTSTQMDKNFFKRDIQVARDSYTTMKGPQSAMLGKKWLEEYKALKQRIELGETVEEEDDTMEFQQILETAENSPEVREVLHRIPCSPRPMSEEMAPAFYQAVAKLSQKYPVLESTYHTITPSATFKSASSRRRGANVYHTIRSPVKIYHTPLPSLFNFSHHFHHDRVPLTPTFSPTSHLPLAPILEGETSQEAPQRNLRLRISTSSPVAPTTQHTPGETTESTSQPATSSQSQPPKASSRVKRSSKLMSILKKPKKASEPATSQGMTPVDEGAPLLEMHPAGQDDASHSTQH